MANGNGQSVSSLGDPVPQIDGALRSLESALNFLDSATTDLYAKIAVVLSPENPCGEGSAEPSYSCPLAVVIQEHARRVRSTAEYLHTIKSRVEL